MCFPVPVIAVFTKFDGLITQAYLDHRREGASSTEAKKKHTERAQALLAQQFIQPLMSMKFPPSDYVALAGDLFLLILTKKSSW
jgi:hypothetical protein